MPITHASQNFSVSIPGLEEVEFQEVSGLSWEYEAIEYHGQATGGKHVYAYYPGKLKIGEVTFKKGRAPMDKHYWEWLKDINRGWKPGSIKEISIKLFAYDMTPDTTWNLYDCWPKKVSLGALKAGASEILIEEMVVVATRIELA